MEYLYVNHLQSSSSSSYTTQESPFVGVPPNMTDIQHPKIILKEDNDNKLLIFRELLQKI